MDTFLVYEPKKIILLVKEMFREQTNQQNVQIIDNPFNYNQQQPVNFAESDNSKPLYLNGDKMKFMQVLINLVKNALKFTSDGTIQICPSYDQELSTLMV